MGQSMNDEERPFFVPKPVSFEYRTASLSSGESNKIVQFRGKAQTSESIVGETIKPTEDIAKPKKQSQIAKELSDIVNYCQAVKFLNFNLSPHEGKTKKSNPKRPASSNSALLGTQNQNQSDSTRLEASTSLMTLKKSVGHHPCYKCSSINEDKCRRLTKRHFLEFLQHTETQLMRVYPAGIRIDSSNFNPLHFWAYGIQLVALNYQTDDIPTHLNYAMFETNQNCGYVLKPRVMWDKDHMMYQRFNPYARDFDGLHALKLKLTIISGQYVCQNTFIGSPMIEVEVYGISNDCNRFKTHVIQRNSFNPIWNSTFDMKIIYKDLAFLRFTVVDTATTHTVAQRIISVNNLRRGYRHMRLRNMQNQQLPISTLFIHSFMDEEEYEIQDISADDNVDGETRSNQDVESGKKRKKFFIKVDYQSTGLIVSMTQDCTTKDLVGRAMEKMEKSGKIEEYILIEEVTPGWEKKDKFVTQRVLGIKEKPLTSKSHWKGEGRFKLKKIADDPSTRAWLATLTGPEHSTEWEEGKNFIVCIMNVSKQNPYMIFKVPKSSTAQMVIAVALIKGKRVLENPVHFVLEEQLDYSVVSDVSGSSKEKKKKIERRFIEDSENIYDIQNNWTVAGKFCLTERNSTLEPERSRASGAAAAISSTISSAINKVGLGSSRSQHDRKPVKETYSDPSMLSSAREGFPERRFKSLYNTTLRATSQPKKDDAKAQFEGNAGPDDHEDQQGSRSDLKSVVRRFKKISMQKIQRVW